MKTVLDRHLRDRILVRRLIHQNQHAYQKGKSCNTDIHELVSKIEQAIAFKEIDVALILDIERAFDNTRTCSTVSRLVSKGTESTLVRWIKNMLSKVVFYHQTYGLWWLMTYSLI